MQLLTLFSDLGLRAAGAPDVVRSLQCLLPAVAAACEGLDGMVMAALSKSAARLSYTDVLQSQPQRTLDVVRLFRNLWLYVGLYRLAEAPQTGAGVRLTAAVGRIAAVTPLMIVDAGNALPSQRYCIASTVALSPGS